MTKCQPKMIRDSNPHFRINPELDPDVHRIAAKMLWIRCRVAVSHFAKFRKNRPVAVWEIVRNLLKCRIATRWKNGKVIQNPYTDPDQHQKLTTSRRSPLAHAYHVWSTSVSAFVSYPFLQNDWLTDRQTDRQNEQSRYSASLDEQINCCIGTHTPINSGCSQNCQKCSEL